MPKKPDVYILGIHDGHNAGASITRNGSVIAAISEERLTGVKNQEGIPVHSIQKVIEIAGISPADIRVVAVASYIRIASDPTVKKNHALFTLHMALAPWFHSKQAIRLAVKLLHRLPMRRDLSAALQRAGIENARIQFVEHHVAHAASAYYQRPWTGETLIFTLDGMGDGLSATVSIGKGKDMKRIASSSYYDSLCNNVYAETVRYLGMRRNEHEYKVMGLAPYGDADQTIDVFRRVFRLNPDNPLEFENRTWRYLETFEPLYRKLLVYKRFDHIAAGVQKFFDDIVCQWIREGVKKTGIHKIVAAGGGFLNVKTNMAVRQMKEVADFFVYPAADDGGLPVGAALVGYLDYCRDHNLSPEISPIGSIYYGQAFSSEEIKTFVSATKWRRRVKKVSATEVARLLAGGAILGRFAGRDEWGPRALGNRSILADPRRIEAITKLNRAVKHRDFWMPFAPAILEEDQSRYLRSARFTPYMTEAFQTTAHTEEIQATVHPADLTVRPMTVNAWNKPFQDIIREFKKVTGVGAVLNTSLNLHGYPMVGTPQQALWTFENSSLDGLLLEDWLITK